MTKDIITASLLEAYASNLRWRHFSFQLVLLFVFVLVFVLSGPIRST